MLEDVRGKLVKRLAGMFLLACLVLVSFRVSAQSLTASLDREVIAMGETVTLTLQFTDTRPDGEPVLPEIPGLRQVGFSSSQQFSTTNRRMSSSVSYQFVLSPTREGTIQIPAMSVQVGGRTLSTQPLTLRVNALPPPPAGEAGISNQVAFLRLVLPKEEAYVGEMLVAEMQLHLSDAVQRLSHFQMQPIASDGFTVGEMVEGNRRQVRLANRIWTVVPLQIPITTVKSGPLTIGPVHCSFTINEDPFFGVFNRGRAARLDVRSDEAQLNCLPLPRQNVPPGFSGAVGRFELAVSAGPTNLAVGDPLTLRVQIAGEGQLDGITLPEQTSWTGFRTMQTKNEVQTSGKLGMSGVKTFEQVLIPESADITALPPFEFSFFDPDARSYQTLRHPAIPLKVRPADALPAPMVAASPGAQQREERERERDIVHIKSRIGNLIATQPILIRQQWFLALAGVPVFIYVSSVVWRRRTDALANNPRLRRKREVDALVHRGLQDLKRQASANDSDAFFATVFRLLQERIGERLNVPASSITESVIDDELKPRQLPEETGTQLHELFQTCNLARYAPVTSSQELNALVPKVEKVLRNLEALP